MKILVVDDEREFVEVLVAAFEIYRPGYTVIATHTGTEGLATAEMTDPDLVILDATLPDLDGLEVCRRMRARRQVPILFLSASGKDEDIAQGMEAGADDYVTKPFRYPTLMARVDDLLFRTTAMPSAERPAVLEWGGLVVDFAQGQVKLQGKTLDLTALEYRILEELARSPGQVISHQTLLDRIWADDYRHDPQNLRVYVYRLRQKIEADPQHPRHIVTHHGEGYRLAGGDLGGDGGGKRISTF
jgi:two-component system KDP operon response regulator KdpE